MTNKTIKTLYIARNKIRGDGIIALLKSKNRKVAH